MPVDSALFWDLISHPYTQWLVLALNAAFLILIIKESIWCWVFGVVASAISVLMFASPGVALYSEALLYSVYVVLGLYAWFNWHHQSDRSKSMPVIRISEKEHLMYLGIGGVVWFMLGYFFKTYTNSSLPWADAFSTSFAFVATYLEARKILESWYYWLVLNLFSIWLYLVRDLPVMSGMMIGFFIFSIVGLLAWKKSYETQNRAEIPSME